MHEDYFALSCGQSQHFWRGSDGGNLSDTRETCKVIEHFMYDPAEKPRYQFPCSLPVPATVPGEEAGSQQKDLTLGDSIE
jgi:hypothetical protein